MHDGRTTAITDPEGGFLSAMRVTGRAVFFEGANGAVDGGQFVYDLDTGTLSRLVHAQNHYDFLLVTRTVVSYLQDDPHAPLAYFPYSFFAAQLVA